MSDKVAGWLLLLVAFVVVVGGLIGVITLISSHNADHTETCTVNNKYIVTKVTNGNSSNEKRVETSCGVFTVNDSFWKGKHRSADTYAKLQNGHKYALTFNGWRNGWSSSFQNITSATEVK